MGSQFSKKRGYEPRNCNKLAYQRKLKDPYGAAQQYINKNPERNCCTIEIDKSVQQWQLPPDEPKVILQKAAKSSTTFYYNNKLKHYGLKAICCNCLTGSCN